MRIVVVIGGFLSTDDSVFLSESFVQVLYLAFELIDLLLQIFGSGVHQVFIIL